MFEDNRIIAKSRLDYSQTYCIKFMSILSSILVKATVLRIKTVLKQEGVSEIKLKIPHRRHSVHHPIHHPIIYSDNHFDYVYCNNPQSTLFYVVSISIS